MWPPGIVRPRCHSNYNGFGRRCWLRRSSVAARRVASETGRQAQHRLGA